MPVDRVGNCPKNNQNLCIKTKPVTVVGDYNGTVLYCVYRNWKTYSTVYCCIRSSRDKLCFYAEIFGTVYLCCMKSLNK